MSNDMLGLSMLGIIVIAIMLGFPTAFTLMGLGIIYGFVTFYDPAIPWYSNGVFDLMVSRTYGVMTNDVLISIPLFVFMGYIIERATLVDKMFHSIQLAARNLPGSLAIAALAVCTVFSMASGIVGAVVALMGLLALPAMLKAGYEKRFSAGVICAGGTLGILIPPSIMLIVYAAVAGISVVRLYAGALFPGFLLAGLYLIYILVRVLINPKLAPPLPRESHVPVKTVLKMIAFSSLPLVLLIAAVLGAILFGVATATESAAIGALGGFLLALVYRQLTFVRLKESVFLTARTTAMICWLFVGSALFSSVFALLGGQAFVEQWVIGLNMTPLQFLILAQLIIFILGWPLEWTEIIVIFVPIFLPLLAHFNIDPVLFGVMVAVNLQAAFLSPPVAMSAFYLRAVAPPSVTLRDIFAGMMPYMGIVILCMILMYIWPSITLWLPNKLYS